jgi:hypothetical protein
MAQWRVQLHGEQFDLRELQEILLGHDPGIFQDGHNFYLTSKTWDQLPDAGEVHNRAKSFLELLASAAYLHMRDTALLAIDGVLRIETDGHTHHFVFAEAGGLTLRGARVRATAVVTGPDNRPVESRQQHQLIRILEVSTQHPDVRDALRFLRKGDWVSLYKAFELLRDEVQGEQEILRRNWITKESLKRFTQMAQSREGLGDAARHASKKYKPPKKAMSLPEARNTIGNLLQTWINSL